MNKQNTELITDVLKKLAKLNYIKPGDVPNINLYMDSGYYLYGRAFK